ncbi:MAG: MATE family efflux transporter [Candidatus Hydrogenedentes bacterium]|nr:MATE family efflux transporter [Candidatus Hydrogenedentota bacterium]
MKQFDKSLVSGSVVGSVWKLAWPGVILNLTNGVPGFVSQALVGHYFGADANAAIGAAWTIFLVMLVLISSLFNGMAVLIARYTGQQDREALSRVAYQTFLTATLFLVLVVGPLGYVCAPSFLSFVNASAQVHDYALPYVRILFTCSAGMFLMFMLSQAMQASGDMKTPMALSIFNSALNLILSAAFITGAGPFPNLGASGAAVGSCLAPFFTLAIALALVLRGKMIIQAPKRFTLIPDLAVMKLVVRIGVPAGLQNVILNIGGVILMRIIGSLPDGAAAQAAYALCYSQLFNTVTFASYGLRGASSIVMGQNIGAGKTERGMAGVRVSAGMGMVWAAAIGVCFWVFSYPLLAVFGATSGPVQEYGASFLRFLAFSGVFLAGGLAYTGALQGAGDTKSPMYIAFITQLGVLLGICALFDHLHLLSTTVIWFAILSSHASRFLATYAVYQRGAWKRITLDIRH